MLCNIKSQLLILSVKDSDAQEDRNAYESELGVFPVITISQRGSTRSRD